MARNTSDFVLSVIEQEILSTLANNRQIYGFQIAEAVAVASQDKRHIGFGTLYPSLHRMEKKGLIQSCWGNEEEGPRRRYYHLTPKGEKALTEMRIYLDALFEWRAVAEGDDSSEDGHGETIEVASTVKVDTRG
ncbi:transcriptional regulator, PadR-like family (plasmid) [Thalassoporum mexicanum PCC 7367]|uniref:PadR family transcriptional regulator n=1 Tax=Thalassoporum mexicanum TaxID=3457544 RepID=UPI00029F9989|nr:helix-turn-helix transcriptional regulator [Pseudanabaena sp. PCC 7367]AFY71976.1 transcriptional regulator, PadR-like family [Pseudanabaena sp. PCC 7367]